MSRGGHREEIFRDDGDWEMMLATLAETVEMTGRQIHAWVCSLGDRVYFESIVAEIASLRVWHSLQSLED